MASPPKGAIVPNRGLLTLEQLWVEVEADRIDTVLIVVTDMQGRLQGKRLSARYFLEEVVAHGSEGCNYLLAVDVDMNTVDGYAMSSWERGYGDFVMRPDMPTLRWLPWHPGSALVFADLAWGAEGRSHGGEERDGTDVVASPRQILRRQLARLAERGWGAYVGTELEFLVFQDTYEEAWNRRYHGLTPANQYNVDYSIMGTSRVEPLLRRIRNAMDGAGMYVESAKGECNLGQHEIAFRYADALSTCDNHVLYKTGAKEIAAQEGSSITFMAKPNEREGNSCHIHISLRDRDGTPIMAGDGPHGLSEIGAHFIAGQLACMRDFTLLYAPNVNSYKRYAPGSFAPTAIKWGRDNRTCALRLVGHSGPSLRVENRVPGGDVNPYLAVSALIAAGLHGIENELPLEEAYEGNAYTSGAAQVRATLREAAADWTGSDLARAAFGDEVVDHYANNANVELAAYDRAVTDWELFRNFERT
ncbi:glutamine synthetase family protein [Actinoallomurus sp. CA-142502]|uniref:glutamine synthetase family protein n=1 Tax=Actinoallomurus sp. CA-142502 TaxID=3239885 RepID=UPI003D8E982C